LGFRCGLSVDVFGSWKTMKAKLGGRNVDKTW
jgi:hypothetical protein